MSQSGRAAWSVITAVAVSLSLWSLVDGATAGNFGGPGCCLVDNGTGCENVSIESSCLNDNGEYFVGQVCGADNTSCREPVTGCCQIFNSTACLESNDNDLLCALSNGTFFEDQTCLTAPGASAALSGITGNCATYTPTATATPTATDTPTATNTPTATDTATVPANTPTATATATATSTATAEGTETMIPDGGDCVDPTDCLSGNCVDDVCCESACDGPDEACNLPGLEGNCLALAATVPAASNNGMILGVVGLLAVALVAFLRRRAAI